MSTLNALIRFSFPNRLRPNAGDGIDSPRTRAIKVQETLHAALLNFEAARVAAQADGRLSDQGKAERIREAAIALRSTIDSIDRGGVGPIRVARDAARQRLIPRDSGANDPGAVIRELAVLQDLRAMNGPERFEVLRRAVIDGDRLVYAAFVNAPRYIDLVPASVAAELKHEWTSRRDPEGAAAFQEVDAIAQTLDENLKDIREATADLLPPADPRESLREVHA